MTEQHYTADEIRMKMRYAEPTMEEWRQRFDELFNKEILPVVMWRLQCLDLMRRAQLQLTYKRHPMLNCPVCHNRREITGCGMRFILGMRRRVCSRCAKVIDKAKLKALRAR